MSNAYQVMGIWELIIYKSVNINYNQFLFHDT